MNKLSSGHDAVLLNLGSGPRSAFRASEASLPPGWQELRVDIDPTCKPDIVASSTDLKAHVQDRSVDVVFSSHSVEHLYDHEVGPAFEEMARVIRPGGFALITCPDIKLVAQHIAETDLEDVIYDSPAGPISALDALYGHRRSIAAGQTYMQHRTGFSAASIARRMLKHGFKEVRVTRGEFLDLWALAFIEPPANLNILSHINRAPTSFSA